MLRIIAVQFGIHREKGSGERAFAEEPAEEVGDHERKEEGVHDKSRAEETAEGCIARQPRHAAGHRQQRHRPRVLLKAVRHAAQHIGGLALGR